MKWYGSLDNRIAERGADAQEIKVGMGATEFYYSDREAYEVVEVRDQKHISIRTLDHKHIGDAYENKWELTSNPNNPVYRLVKRGKYWYTESVVTREDIENFEEWDVQDRIWFGMNGFDLDVIREKGVQKRYHRKNIVVGYADYYYDYSF